MDPIKKEGNYPAGTVILSNLVSLAIYVLGFLILLKAGLVFALIYLLYILFFEYRLIRYHCPDCYYYGKTCGFGRGRISAWFFKKGDPSKFCAARMTWKDMIPDLLIILIPFIAGIILLIIKFDLLLLLAMVIILFCATAGNSFVRGKLTCAYCKQGETGCPAQTLFNNKDKENLS